MTPSQALMLLDSPDLLHISGVYARGHQAAGLQAAGPLGAWQWDLAAAGSNDASVHAVAAFTHRHLLQVRLLHSAAAACSSVALTVAWGCLMPFWADGWQAESWVHLQGLRILLRGAAAAKVCTHALKATHCCLVRLAGVRPGL